MEDIYLLKHRDTLCATMTIEEYNGRLIAYKVISPECLPYLGTADLRKISQWWETRAIPASRTIMDTIIRAAGCETHMEYLAKNLALSVTDCYWVCPLDTELSWEDVALIGHTELDALPYHDATSYDPNASLGGQMEKYWDMSGKKPMLVKTAPAHYGLQAVNEAFATWIHERQDTDIPFVHYDITRRPEDGSLQCICPCFVTVGTEYIPALEVIRSKKRPGDQALYDAYIDICAAHGIDRDAMQTFMDYQTLTDFVISNTDEHLLNFGILRDAESLRFIAPAPIFDSGNSMFYANRVSRNRPYTRAEILARKITAFHNAEEKMLAHIKDRSIVRADRLPSPEETAHFYASRGIPEHAAQIISQNYAVKLALLSDFQSGMTISLYHEKEAEKKQKHFC